MPTLLLVLLLVLPISAQDSCPAGQYSTDSSGCQPCPTTAYCVFSAAYACPANSSTGGNATSIDACACDDGFRLRVDYGTRRCSPCAAGSFCRNGSVGACGFLETSPVGSVTASACTCQPGSRRVNGTCTSCPADFFCTGGEGGATACPAHAHSLAGSYTAADCQCLAPFAGLYAHGAFACYHISELGDVAHALPQVATVNLQSHVSLSLDSLNAFQRDAVWLGSDLRCHGPDGRAEACPHVLRGGMLNATHALMLFDNAAVAPEFLNVVNYALRSVELLAATYMVERTVWFVSDRVVGARAQAVHLEATTHVLTAAQNHDADARQLVAALRAAVHNHTRHTGSLATVEQVVVEDAGLRIGYHWLHARGSAARQAALTCLGVPATAGEGLDASGFAALGAYRCPGPAAFACAQAVLGSATDYDDRGVECTLTIRVLHDSDEDLGPAVAAAVGQLPAFAAGAAATHELRVLHVLDLRTSHFEFVLALAEAEEAAGAVLQDALSVLLDTGTQTTAVLTGHVGAHLGEATWGELLLTANFSALRAWELEAVTPSERYELLLLSFLAHNASRAFQVGTVGVSLANHTLTVENYVLGRQEMQEAARTLCTYTSCTDCAALSEVSSHARLQGTMTLQDTSRAVMLDALAVLPAAGGVYHCNATQTQTTVVAEGDPLLACDRVDLRARAEVTVPLPPEIVMSFLADVLVSTAAGDVDVTDYHVAPAGGSGGSSVVTLYVHAPTQADCVTAEFVNVSLVSAALLNIWPFAGSTTVVHTCVATCEDKTIDVDVTAAGPANETLQCTYAFDHAYPLADTQDAAMSALPAGASFHLETTLEFATSCDISAIQRAFDELDASEYAFDPPASTQWFHEYSVWNAAQKTACGAGRGCAHAINVTLEEGCLVASALNVHLASAKIQAAILRDMDHLPPPAPVVQLVSDPVWLPAADLAGLDAVLAPYTAEGSLDVSVQAGFLLHHSVAFARSAPFSDAYEHLLQSNVTEGAGAAVRNRVQFDIFTVSSITSVNTTSERVNFVAAALELLLSPTTTDFAIQSLSHTALAQSPRLGALTAEERLLVDDADAELMLTVQVATSKTCRDVHALLQAWQPFPVPFTDSIYFHVLHRGIQCETQVELFYPAVACSERVQYGSLVHNETCTEGAAWQAVTLNATDDVLFFKGLDLVTAAGAVPVQAVAFESVLRFCDAGGDGDVQVALEQVAAEHGEFFWYCLCVCVGRGLRNTRVPGVVQLHASSFSFLVWLVRGYVHLVSTEIKGHFSVKPGILYRIYFFL